MDGLLLVASRRRGTIPYFHFAGGDYQFDGPGPDDQNAAGVFGMEDHPDLQRVVFARIDTLLLPADCLDDKSADELGLSPHGGRVFPSDNSRAIRTNESDVQRYTVFGPDPHLFCGGRKGIWLALSADFRHSILFSAPNRCVRAPVDAGVAGAIRLPGVSGVGIA